MSEQPIFTRAMAALQGATRFYTGQPCKHGHKSERYTSTGACIACLDPLWRAIRPQWNEKIHRPNLRVPGTITDEQRQRLTTYLQTCVTAFAKAEGLYTAPGNVDSYQTG